MYTANLRKARTHRNNFIRLSEQDIITVHFVLHRKSQLETNIHIAVNSGFCITYFVSSFCTGVKLCVSH